jgi:hypothetical protein
MYADRGPSLTAGFVDVCVNPSAFQEFVGGINEPQPGLEVCVVSKEAEREIFCGAFDSV